MKTMIYIQVFMYWTVFQADPRGQAGYYLLIKSDECIVINKYYLILFLNYENMQTLLSLV